MRSRSDASSLARIYRTCTRWVPCGARNALLGISHSDRFPGGRPYKQTVGMQFPGLLFAMVRNKAFIALGASLLVNVLAQQSSQDNVIWEKASLFAYGRDHGSTNFAQLETSTKLKWTDCYTQLQCARLQVRDLEFPLTSQVLTQV